MQDYPNIKCFYKFHLLCRFLYAIMHRIVEKKRAWQQSCTCAFLFHASLSYNSALWEPLHTIFASAFSLIFDFKGRKVRLWGYLLFARHHHSLVFHDAESWEGERFDRKRWNRGERKNGAPFDAIRWMMVMLGGEVWMNFVRARAVNLSPFIIRRADPAARPALAPSLPPTGWDESRAFTGVGASRSIQTHRGISSDGNGKGGFRDEIADRRMKARGVVRADIWPTAGRRLSRVCALARKTVRAPLSPGGISIILHPLSSGNT